MGKSFLVQVWEEAFNEVNGNFEPPNREKKALSRLLTHRQLLKKTRKTQLFPLLKEKILQLLSSRREVRLEIKGTKRDNQNRRSTSPLSHRAT